MGKKELRDTREHYSEGEDATIRQLSLQRWSQPEIAYRLYKEHGTVRSIASVCQRVGRLRVVDSTSFPGRGKCYVTAEALRWINKTRGTKITTSPLIEYRDRTKAQQGTPKGDTTKKATSREVLGFSRTKPSNEANPSYMVKAVKMTQMEGNPLGLFRDLLESGMAEGKTAVDILDDLRLIGA